MVRKINEDRIPKTGNTTMLYSNEETKIDTVFKLHTVTCRRDVRYLNTRIESERTMKRINTRKPLWKRTLKLTNTAMLIYYLCSLVGVQGFNLDVSFPTIATIPEKKSYFGYSVDLYVGKDESWLLVGAPKSNVRGEVYKCEYKGGSNVTCSKINFVKDDSATDAVKDMFGMTIKVGQANQLLACAPYFTQRTEKLVREETIVYYDLLGICYLVDLAEVFTANTLDTFKIIPCQSAKGKYHDGDLHGSCQAGLSADFTKDGKNVLMGTAGSFYRQGAIMLLQLPLIDDVTILPVHTGENKPSTPEGWSESNWIMQSYDDNYLGYSVATGKSPGNSQLLFASAPRRFGYDLLGMVVVYDDGMDAVLYNFTGNQTGGYFGSGLAAVDLNNDNLDDVIIGAPLYSNFDRKMAENGRVYVYYQMKAGVNPEDGTTILRFTEPIVIEGKVDRARFGHVIHSIGDINQDGYNDIAISAPYTSNGAAGRSDGSVFIFNGGPEGLRIPASQEIKGIDLSNTTAGLGISISGEKDVDRNKYPDVLIGAYMSDQAILFKSRPVVEIASVVEVSPKTIDIEARSCPSGSAVSCFEITTCFSYYGLSLPSSIHITYIYDIDTGKTGNEKRAYILDESRKNLTLVRDESNGRPERKCVSEWAYLKTDIRDKLTEINVSVSHALVEKKLPVQPILDDLLPAFSAARVNIFKDCGADDICEADLRLTSKLDHEVVYVGQDLPILLDNVVNNFGESAFLTTLVVEFPINVDYVGTQDKQKSSGLTSFCANVDQFVTCELGNPMKRDEVANVMLKFKVYTLSGNVSQLTFKSFVNSTNPVKSTSNILMTSLLVQVKSNMVIYNNTSPEIIFLDDVNLKEDKKKQTKGNMTSVIHTYEIINSGPSDIESGTINIYWPLRTNSGKELLDLVEIVEFSTSCGYPNKSRSKRQTETTSNTTDDANYYYCNGGAECLTITCSVESLRRQQELSVSIHATMPLSTVLDNDLDSYIRSNFEFKIDKYPYEINRGPGPTIRSEITTKCLYVREPEAKEVQWWIIAIAVAAGVLVLILLVFALWRCGFFKRKRKPETDQDREQKERLNPGGDDAEQEMEKYLK